MVPFERCPRARRITRGRYFKREWRQVLEPTSYGLTGLVAVLLVVFCFACKDDFASFRERPSSSPMFDADLLDLKPVERRRDVANGDTRPQDQKQEWVLHG
jgi:hypothetical protein